MSSQKIYCPECDQPLRNTYYCHPCQRTHFQEDFENWTSGDTKIDQYIRNTQLSAKECTDYLEWILFTAFINISKYEHTELGTVFTANWEQGPADTWDPIEGRFIRNRELAKVALITLGSDPVETLKELNLQYKGRKNTGLIMRLFGMTQEPVTGNYMIVAEMVEWDLRHYVSHHFVRLTWQQKLAILHTLAVELANLRAKQTEEFAKRDNTIRSHLEVQVKELGLGDCTDFVPVIGYYRYDVLPFFAPEVLLDVEAKQTSKAEVYMFGMLMWEFATNRPPFYDTPRDANLVAAIASGKRPKIPYGMPDCYARLMQECWHTEPLFRPDIHEISRILGEWHLYNTEKEAFGRAERQRYREVKARGLNPDGKMLTPPKVHPQAIYTSRLLKFSIMPKQREKTRIQTASYLERQEQRDLESISVRDESFFMSRTLIRKRNKFPEIEPEPEDDDLLRQCNELSIDYDEFLKDNRMLVEVN